MIIAAPACAHRSAIASCTERAVGEFVIEAVELVPTAARDVPLDRPLPLCSLHGRVYGGRCATPHGVPRG